MKSDINYANPKKELYSSQVKAGKRTYFFDVKTTKSDDLYLTITESKRIQNTSGDFSYEKHRLFLYPEDLKKFEDSLHEIIQYISPEDNNIQTQDN